MEVTKNAYSLLQAQLQEIDQTVINGLLNNCERDACFEIKNLVHQTRQIINQNFFVDGNDEPPAQHKEK